jgi:hypothetical protein
MIFGLMVSTGLTLFVIPSLYVVMVEKTGMTVFSEALDSDQTSENGRRVDLKPGILS